MTEPKARRTRARVTPKPIANPKSVEIDFSGDEKHIMIYPRKIRAKLCTRLDDIFLFSHLLLIHTRSINSEIINSYYHIRRYTDKVSQTRQCNQASCSSLLSATGQWALGQPRKESQFPAFGNLHKSPSWRQASGQTVEFDEEESMVG